MRSIDPNETFHGTLVIVSPHMDDEVLACGGLIAKLSNKERIHIIYATDGMKSPAPILPGIDSISLDLGKVRMAESAAAMEFMGIQAGNLHFLGLPEAQLRDNISALNAVLSEVITRIQPDTVFIPFRYDRHPDHLAINQVITEGHRQGEIQAQLVEFFIYHRWKLLPKQDIRKYIKPDCLMQVDIRDVAQQKRTALNCFESQTTIYYAWQTRPILTPPLLDEESQEPEYYLFYDPAFPGSAVFTHAIVWIKIAHRLEPFLQKWKYLAGAFIKRIFTKYARKA